MAYTPLPVVITEPCIHLTLKLNLPKRLVDDPEAAVLVARTVAADECERLVRYILAEGVYE